MDRETNNDAQSKNQFLIIGGNWNAVLNPQTDRIFSTGITKVYHRQNKILKKLLSLNLKDAYTLLSPDNKVADKDFTFIWNATDNSSSKAQIDSI